MAQPEFERHLEPLPAGAVRCRCWCNWWIAVPSQVYSLFCPLCEILLRPCTESDFLDAGVVNVLGGPNGGKPLKKVKKAPEIPTEPDGFDF